ncbi:MAG: cell division protein FtsB [Bacteroidetes bacterium 46-16]|nr:MAG: cell division protein FtsB [Bacteroidetes bacterium 46-16]
MKKGYIHDLFLTRNWYLGITGAVVLFFLSFFFPVLFGAATAYTLFFFLLSIVDYCLLFLLKGKVTATRQAAARFSLGDKNAVSLVLNNTYPFKIKAGIIDELPVQFQERNFHKSTLVPIYGSAKVNYELRPRSRGAYEFGHVICFIKTPLRLLQRRVKAAEPMSIKVYPSFHQLKKYQLLAVSDHAVAGIKKIRRLGHSLEFEKIKEYVTGDDVRTINWKATARTGNTMVNTYTDARQQQVYCILDKGRAMKMPFDGITLLDHSINAGLALMNVALLKHDKAGMITFADKVSDIIPAERRSGQLTHLLEALYKQATEFKESDMENLWATIHKRVTQRSFILLFTNFETYSALERQLPYLKKIASYHLLCIVFFRNTLLREIQEKQPDTVEGIYIKTIAERFDYEKRQIVKELRRHGILSILSTPGELSIDVVNKYLELKARQMI